MTFESLDIQSPYLNTRCISSEYGQVRTWRSTGQGQGHRSKMV